MKFIFIIDEWDAIIRETGSDIEIQNSYLNLLREWFKNGNFTSKTVAAAYMTGILPIKKDQSQSAISDFREFTIIKPAIFAKYTGFTESEVRQICHENAMDFESAKKWYDGYSFGDAESIYNPYSVMMAMNMKEYESYRKQTSAAENLVTYINMNMEYLQSDIVKLIAGEYLKVNITNFHNDFQTFKSKDDVLTLLIHLGYLAYASKEKRVRIPNEEVRF
ncbi:MAG: AAA family ATPase [Lachnospiraceae bacterium]|nr:AAA family ATPase [Lachnospiraceae bacterium]